MKKSEVRKLYKVFKRYDFFNDCAIMATDKDFAISEVLGEVYQVLDDDAKMQLEIMHLKDRRAKR